MNTPSDAVLTGALERDSAVPGRDPRYFAAAYYLMMMVLVGAVTLTGGGAALLAGNVVTYALDWLQSALFWVAGASLLGAVVLFWPIHRFLQGARASEGLRQRVRQLPLLSAVLISAITAAFMVPELGWHHDPSSTVPARLVYLRLGAMLAVFAILMGLLVYLVVSEYTVRLRRHLWETGRLDVRPARGGVRTRLVMTFLVISIAPLGAILLHGHVGRDVSGPHSASLQHLFFADLAAVLVLVVACSVFITRSLTVPIGTLVSTVRAIANNDLDARAPSLSDDELGVLAMHINEMAVKLKEHRETREVFNQFVPKAVAARLLAEHGTLQPRSHEATVLFSDIRGFTAVTQALAPAQVIALLNQYFEAVSEPVNRYGGVITQFQGDAMLVTFNVPVVDAHHADNALRAALEIQHVVKTRRFLGDVQLPTRIGINTGPVVGGTVGGGGRLGYTVHGDAVNVAARLEELNNHYKTDILVSQSTAAQASSLFALRPLGESPLRGRKGTVMVHELVVDDAA